MADVTTTLEKREYCSDEREEEGEKRGRGVRLQQDRERPGVVKR